MPVVHHTAICTRDVEASLHFWSDGMGFTVMMDERFVGDWPTLLRGPQTSLRSIFLGDPAAPEAGIVELVDLGPVEDRGGEPPPLGTGFLLVSVMADVEVTLARLASLGLGGTPRRIETFGVAMSTVVDPNGVVVELIEATAVHRPPRGQGR